MPLNPVQLVGGSYTSRARSLDLSQSVNCYVEPSADKKRGTLIGTPGLRRWTTLTDRPVRGLYTASGSRVFAVAGRTFYELFPNQTSLPRGNLITTAGIVTFADDGQHVVAVDGQKGYLLTLAGGSTFAPITDPDWKPASHVAYLNGVMIFNELGSGRFFWSQILDPGNLDALDFASAEARPDPLVGLKVSHGELILFGSTSVEWWVPTGNFLSPFQRLPGAVIDLGCYAGHSIRMFRDTVGWLASDPSGGFAVMVANGYKPQKVSTDALESAFTEWANLPHATALTYTQDAHPFYLLNAPAQQTSVCYDGETQTWHNRAWLAEDGSFERWRGEVNTFGFQRHLVGDFEDGRIYDMRLDHYFDDERALVRVRRMPSVEAQQQRLRHSLFRLRLDAGVGLDGGQVPGSDPQMRLRWSDDDGSSWSREIWRSAGKIGNTGQVCEWRQLGQSRQRSYELRCSDPVPVRWTAAWVEVS